MTLFNMKGACSNYRTGSLLQSRWAYPFSSCYSKTQKTHSKTREAENKLSRMMTCMLSGSCEIAMRCLFETNGMIHCGQFTSLSGFREFRAKSTDKMKGAFIIAQVPRYSWACVQFSPDSSRTSAQIR